jgi:outer membrane protein
VAYEVQQALLDYESAQAQQLAAERQFDAGQESLRAAEARYGVGTSTLLEVTQARSVFVEASVNRIQALYTILLNEMEIAYTLGRIEPFLTQLP